MAEALQIASFENGELKLCSGANTGAEVVLALPLSRMLVKTIMIPESERDNKEAFVTRVLQELSPYPDEELSVSCEIMRETSEGISVIAAALPESSAEDIAEALDDAKLTVRRIDALALGELFGLWNKFGISGDDARRLLIIKSADCIALIVIDDDMIVSIRAASLGAEIRREIWLSLLQAEDFAGAKALAGVYIASRGECKWEDDEKSVLASFGEITDLGVLSLESAYEGIARRSDDEHAINVLPASWRENLDEVRMKKKLTLLSVMAGGIWALIMAVLFGVPLVLGFMTDHQKKLCSAHAGQYRAVSAMREKVKLVQKYSDRTLSALEILKALSDRLPQGVTLTSWNYDSAEGVRCSGTAENDLVIYDFKDALDKLGVFSEVKLTGPSRGRDQKQRFDIACLFAKEDYE